MVEKFHITTENNKVKTNKFASLENYFKMQGAGYAQPFKPQDQNLNSHLLPLFISYKSSGEKLIKYQANSSCVIMSVILMTTPFYKALILQGEI